MRYHILISLENLHNFRTEEDKMEICLRAGWVCWYFDVLASKKEFLENKNKVKVLANLIEGMSKSLGYFLRTNKPKHLDDIRDYIKQLDIEFLELWDFNETLDKEFMAQLDPETASYLKVLYSRKDTLQEVA